MTEKIKYKKMFDFETHPCECCGNIKAKHAQIRVPSIYGDATFVKIVCQDCLDKYYELEE
jgi:hypothetical protein